MLKKVSYLLLVLILFVVVGCEEGIENTEEAQSVVDKQYIEMVKEELLEEPAPEQEGEDDKPVEIKEEPKDKPAEPEEPEEPTEPEEPEEPTEPEEPEESEEPEEEEVVGTGVFAWPTNERDVVRQYGPHERGGFYRGIGILAPKGAPVYAADNGTVSLSGFRAGYGNLIVINHNNNYMTYYGYNSKNLVNVGDIVEKGEKIAEVGNTGSSPTPLLHFEIRINNETVNPLDYLP